MLQFLRFFLAILCVAQMASLAYAVKTDQAEVSLLSARQSFTPEQQQLAFGLKFQLQPDWKIYWRAPGAGGKPPILHWQEKSRNVAGLEIQWPYPKRFRTYGLLSNGYEGHVVLPLIVTRKPNEQDLELNITVDFFICNIICIPDQVVVQRTLSVGNGALNPDDFQRITDAQKRVPSTEYSTFTVSRPEAIQGHDGRMRIDWTVDNPAAFSNIDVFFDAEAEFSEPVFDFTPDRKQFRLSVEARRMKPESDIALVFQESADTFSRHESTDIMISGLAWGWVLLLALAGGMLINVMPCVLPVLFVKIFAALNHQAERTRQGFFVMSLGIICTFGALGGVFAALRAGGAALHWGMQFQQPIFLTAMVFVLMAFATQLLGWWQIPLPRLFSAPQKGLFGDFTTGILTAILATPCSAPLVGTSIGLALFVPPVQMIIILLTMGLGMALPYLLLAAYPPILKLLPKPGKWMETLKVLLALSVFGTALWVVWLLLAQIGINGAFTVLIVASLMVFALGMVKFPETKIAPHRFKLAVLLVLLGLMLPTRFEPPDTASTISEGWQAFAPETITEHIAHGKTVLVDISADWCITCQVNDRLVLNQPEILAWRKRDAVMAMRGDWSRPDAKIKAFLARYQKQALPFAILFTPHAPEGILLPELLTMTAFQRIHREAKAQEF